MTDQSLLDPAESLPAEIEFPRGIPGFEDLGRFELRCSDTESGRIYRLVAKDHSDVIFTLVDPRLYGLNYVLELSDEDQDVLQAERPEDVAVLLMLWKKDLEQPGEAPGLHANIAGPILINVEKRLGMQKDIATPRVELQISN